MTNSPKNVEQTRRLFNAEEAAEQQRAQIHRGDDLTCVTQV